MNKLHKRRKATLLGLCQVLWAMLLTGHTPSLAGSFQVSPVGIQMTARERAAALHLSNTGHQALMLLAEVMHWSQDAEGQDRLEPSNDLVLSPPVIVLPPGASQVVRLARLVPYHPDQGQSYRLIVREARPQGMVEQDMGQIPVLLGMSLPVLLLPPRPVRKLACEAQATHATRLTLFCTNEGNAVVRVVRIALGPPSEPLARFEGAAYWLPGSHHRLDLQSMEPIATGPHPLTVWFDDDQTTLLNITVR